MTGLCKIKGARGLQLLRTTVFNTYGVEVYGISVDSSDTVFTYQVQTDRAFNRKEQSALQNLTGFCWGFAAAIQATE